VTSDSRVPRAPVVSRLPPRRTTAWPISPAWSAARRNPHRTGTGWTLGTVTTILQNPRYTGHQVWNRQRTDKDLANPADVSLGTRTCSGGTCLTGGSSPTGPPTRLWLAKLTSSPPRASAPPAAPRPGLIPPGRRSAGTCCPGCWCAGCAAEIWCPGGGRANARVSASDDAGRRRYFVRAPGLVLPRGSRMPWRVYGLSVRDQGGRSRRLRGNWG
jgi:Recombinase